MDKNKKAIFAQRVKREDEDVWHECTTAFRE